MREGWGGEEEDRITTVSAGMTSFMAFFYSNKESLLSVL
jgi:hypothetical protein